MDNDDLEPAPLLISAGANVKAETRYGLTPLYMACLNGDAAMIEKLLAAGADPNTANRAGETALMTASRTGKVDAAVIIPAQYSRRVYAQDAPRVGLVVDNSDQIMSGSIESEMQSLVNALNQPVIQDRVVKNIALQIVELYPYVEYMKYLL
mgnify:CR=1 FL=1